LRKEHHITVENFKLEVKDITCGGGDGEFTWNGIWGLLQWRRYMHWGVEAAVGIVRLLICGIAHDRSERWFYDISR
jgi:hypothetical protein